MTIGCLAAALIPGAAHAAAAQDMELPPRVSVRSAAPLAGAADSAARLDRLAPLLGADAGFTRLRRAADLALHAAMLAEGDRDERLRRLAEAESHARAALDLDPDDARSRFLLGAAIGIGIQYRSGRAKLRAAAEVRQLADAILRDHPDDAGGLHLDGQLHAAAMRLGGIEKFVARTILGGDVLSDASWEEAEASFRAALRAEPGNPAHRWELALLLRDTGRREEARSELQRIVESTALSPMSDLFRRRAWAVLAELQ